MNFNNIPVDKPTPDSKRFIDILLGKSDGSKPPLVEYLVDDNLMKPIVTDLIGRPWVIPQGDRESLETYLDNFIEFWHRMGYDFVRFEMGMGFQINQIVTSDTGSDKQRAWVDQHKGRIRSWEDFENYPWPQMSKVDFFPYEYINDNLPEGMGLMCCHAGGPYEHLSSILSYEGLCLALYDAPDLVKAISDKLGELMTQYYEHLLELDNVIAIFPGDDMGFHSGTLISPDALREYGLPWHKRFAKMAHEKGVPYFVHSCGNTLAIAEDLIEDVRIDAKHSFEDSIIPIEEFQRRYGCRIGVLGGVDVHTLSAGTPDDVRARVRFLLETCGSRGRFAIGSGNSIPSYIPVENYLTMLDETLGFQND